MTSKKKFTIGLMNQGGGNWLGGSLYIENICRSLLSLPPEERSKFRLVLFGNSLQMKKFESLVSPDFHLVDLSTLPPASYLDKQRYRLQKWIFGQKTPWFNRLLKREGIDFLYPYCPPDSKPKDFRSASWLPDFQHVLMPEMFSPQELQERDANLQQIIDHSEILVLSSYAAKTHCQIYSPKALHKVKVLEFPSVLESDSNIEEISAERTYNLPKKFFLLSNQFWRHKNHKLVLQALTILAKQNIYPVVVCTGHTYDYRHPGYFDEILGEIHRCNLSTQVRILGVIPRNLQLQLMQSTCAVLQPSLFEGWNTTVEDARALGCQILMSDIDVHIEQSPPHGIYFKSDDPKSLAKQMLAIWQGESVLSQNKESKQILHEQQRSRVLDFAKKFLTMAEEKDT